MDEIESKGQDSGAAPEADPEVKKAPEPEVEHVPETEVKKAPDTEVKKTAEPEVKKAPPLWAAVSSK